MGTVSMEISRAAHLHDIPIGAADEATQSRDDAPCNDEGAEPGGGSKDAQQLVGGYLHRHSPALQCASALPHSSNLGSQQASPSRQRPLTPPVICLRAHFIC